MGSTSGSQLKRSFAIALLALQMGGVVYARLSPKRYFCWAPNDYVADYKLGVAVQGRELSSREILARYRLPEPFGVYENPAEHIISLIHQYETTYGVKDHASVTLEWRLNNQGPTRRWEWPAARN